MIRTPTVTPYAGADPDYVDVDRPLSLKVHGSVPSERSQFPTNERLEYNNACSLCRMFSQLAQESCETTKQRIQHSERNVLRTGTLL